MGFRLPARVRLLGEDLVAFRDSDGRVGLIGEFCPNRNAPLFFGRNEESGLRCLYHGWKVASDGTVLEMSSEPPERSFARKVKHRAYPTRESGGIVWTYMGPAEQMPEFEPPVFQPTDDSKISGIRASSCGKPSARWPTAAATSWAPAMLRSSSSGVKCLRRQRRCSRANRRSGRAEAARRMPPCARLKALSRKPPTGECWARFHKRRNRSAAYTDNKTFNGLPY